MTKEYTKEYIDYMIGMIRKYQGYEDGVLESMTGAEIKEIFECLVDWLG